MDNEKELKLYLERVIVLEVTIYKQKKNIYSLEQSAQEKLYTGHKSLIPYPERIREAIEECDNYDIYKSFYQRKKVNDYHKVKATFVFAVILFLTFFLVRFEQNLVIRLLFIFLVFSLGFIYIYMRLKQENKKIWNESKEYKKYLEEQKKRWLSEKYRIDKQNENIDIQNKKCDQDYNTTMRLIQNMKEKLNENNKKLQSLYSLNYIHPKYRNIIAICRIYEYFDTGIVDGLTGTSGAYRLYEDEKRQGMVISELKRIGVYLGDVISNQSKLYDELNDTLKDQKDFNNDIVDCLTDYSKDINSIRETQNSLIEKQNSLNEDILYIKEKNG